MMCQSFTIFSNYTNPTASQCISLLKPLTCRFIYRQHTSYISYLHFFSYVTDLFTRLLLLMPSSHHITLWQRASFINNLIVDTTLTLLVQLPDVSKSCDNGRYWQSIFHGLFLLFFLLPPLIFYFTSIFLNPFTRIIDCLSLSTCDLILNCHFT